MDSGEGRMASISPSVAKEQADAGRPTFQVGQILEINGSRFRVKRIGNKDLVLRIQPR